MLSLLCLVVYLALSSCLPDAQPIPNPQRRCISIYQLQSLVFVLQAQILSLSVLGAVGQCFKCVCGSELVSEFQQYIYLKIHPVLLYQVKPIQHRMSKNKQGQRTDDQLLDSTKLSSSLTYLSFYNMMN